MPRRSAFLPAKSLDIFRRILLGRDDGPQDRSEERRGADVKRQPDGQRDCVSGALGCEMKHVGQQPGQRRRHHRAEPDEQALHRETLGALFLRQQVGDERAKRFHADVDGGVQDPEQAGGHPQRGTTRHQDERAGTENRSRQKVRTTASQARPGVIAGVADDRLHDQAGERSRQPQDRDLVGARPEIFVDGAHVGHLQPPAKLDAEKAEAHVPDLPEALARLLHAVSSSASVALVGVRRSPICG